jgi:uptake hydrogenase large subunit
VNLEGELVVRLVTDGANVRSATIRSSRPLAAARVLTGRTSRDAAALVPRLYSICARAQGAAAAAALDAAQGRRSVVAHAARELAVRLEALQEGLFRLLIDLPQAAGLAGDVAPVAAARRAVAAALTALDAGDEPRAVGRAAGAALAPVFEAHVHGLPAVAWLALTDAAAIDRWAATSAVPPAAVLRALGGDAPGLGRSDVASLPAAGAATLAAKLLPAMDADPAFAHAPHWQGAPAETGALARRGAHPGLAALVARDGATAAVRIVARLADLAALLVALDGDAGADDRRAAEPRWLDAIAPMPGEGFATVETARGLLVHRARVDGDIVTGYAIVAPTEWNFGADGPLVRGLAGLAAADDATLERRARLAVHALDPCVACRIEVAHA